MWKSKATATAAPMPSWTPRAEGRADEDAARQHAFNWWLGVSGMGSAGVLAIWWLLYRGGVTNVDTLATWLPLAPIAATGMASWKLVKYTCEYRREWYQSPTPRPATPETPEAGASPGGTLLRGVDGRMQRVAVALTQAEILAVKQALLTKGTYNVTALSPTLGERASLLRQELYRLGILEEPKDRATTRLTPAGRQAVELWQ